MKLFIFCFIFLFSTVALASVGENVERTLDEEISEKCIPVLMGLCAKCTTDIAPVCSYNNGKFQWHRNSCFLLSKGCNPTGIEAMEWYQCENCTSQCQEIPVEFN